MSPVSYKLRTYVNGKKTPQGTGIKFTTMIQVGCRSSQTQSRSKEGGDRVVRKRQSTHRSQGWLVSTLSRGSPDCALLSGVGENCSCLFTSYLVCRLVSLSSDIHCNCNKDHDSQWIEVLRVMWWEIEHIEDNVTSFSLLCERPRQKLWSKMLLILLFVTE